MLHGGNDLESCVRSDHNIRVRITDNRVVTLIFAAYIKEIANVRHSFAVLAPEPPEFLVAYRAICPWLFGPSALCQQMTAVCVDVVTLTPRPDMDDPACLT